MILNLKLSPVDAQSVDPSSHFRAELTTTAGTYVKEFVSGDFGKTTPSLCSLLNCEHMKVVTLDVVSVCLDWP